MGAEHWACQEMRRSATQALINELGTRATRHLRTNINDLAARAGVM